jgi:hypothetical protein
MSSDLNINQQDVSGQYSAGNTDETDATQVTPQHKVAITDSIVASEEAAQVSSSSSGNSFQTPVLSNQIAGVSAADSGKAVIPNTEFIQAGQTVAGSLSLDNVKNPESKGSLSAMAYMKTLSDAIQALEQEINRQASDIKDIRAQDPDNPDSPLYAGSDASLAVLNGPVGQQPTKASQLALAKNLANDVKNEMKMAQLMAGPFATINFIGGNISMYPKALQDKIGQLNKLLQNLGIVDMKTSRRDFARDIYKWTKKLANTPDASSTDGILGNSAEAAGKKAADQATRLFQNNPKILELYNISVKLNFTGNSDYLKILLDNPDLLHPLQDMGILPKDASTITNDQIKNLQTTIQAKMLEIAKSTSLTLADFEALDTIPNPAEAYASAHLAEMMKPIETYVQNNVSPQLQAALKDSTLPQDTADTLINFIETTIFTQLLQSSLAPSKQSPTTDHQIIEQMKDILNAHSESNLAEQLVNSLVGEGNQELKDSLTSLTNSLLVGTHLSVMFASAKSSDGQPANPLDFLENNQDLSPILQNLTAVMGLGSKDLESNNIQDTLNALDKLNLHPGDGADNLEALRAMLKMLKQILANLMNGQSLPAIGQTTAEVSDKVGVSQRSSFSLPPVAA